MGKRARNKPAPKAKPGRPERTGLEFKPRDLEDCRIEQAEILANSEIGLQTGRLDWSGAFGHAPVLLTETMEALRVKPDGFYVDCTLGGGGHARAILERLGPEGRLLALDRDPEPLEWAGVWGNGDPRLITARLNFADLAEYLKDRALGQADGIVADLGLNSRQLATAERGFSFALDGPLDMRFDPEEIGGAHRLIHTAPEPTLADIFWRYGQERSAKKLARLVVERREKGPIEGTLELAAIAEKALWRPGPKPKIHPATKMFMALRLFVNGELEALDRFLGTVRGCLKPGGVLAVISFQSFEDKRVKMALRGEAYAEGADDGDEDDDKLSQLSPSGRAGLPGRAGRTGDPQSLGPKSKKDHFHKARENRVLLPEDLKAIEVPPSPWRPLKRKAQKPTAKEIADNPRARSARLRAAEAV
ncbi:MAG: 16S rRNA (cytosine(1402)-N(4))-methyltransferase RsmH [Deltaproteobacteria bacterium]|jgi:16S rRNA (cytosine1402-N4)-methyltransferase|nr:16S rRNA (cytosine(1402)-N(4))-methyltransferase RsmH [Deltaproteobacteria bacterium]